MIDGDFHMQRHGVRCDLRLRIHPVYLDGTALGPGVIPVYELYGKPDRVGTVGKDGTRVAGAVSLENGHFRSRQVPYALSVPIPDLHGLPVNAGQREDGRDEDGLCDSIPGGQKRPLAHSKGDGCGRVIDPDFGNLRGAGNPSPVDSRHAVPVNTIGEPATLFVGAAPGDGGGRRIRIGEIRHRSALEVADNCGPAILTGCGLDHR